jgi:DNA primase
VAPDDLRALEAATSLYHQRLLTDSLALAYLEGRGVSRELIVECRLGYAAGSELLAYLRWRSLPLGPAMRVGLLDAAGREFLAGRIVIPELRSGQPVWLVGRILEPISMDAAGARRVRNTSACPARDRCSAWSMLATRPRSSLLKESSTT